MVVDYLDGKQSLVLKKTPIVSASSERDNKMDGLISVPSTMMCFSLMVRPGLDRSTCCQQDFHVNPLAWLAADLLAMIPETVGLPPSESYARWDVHSCGWKTSQVSLLDLMGISEPSSVNFTKAGMMRSGELSALPQLAHPINGTGFGSSRTNQALWPTPVRSDSKNITLPPSQAKWDSLVGELIRRHEKGRLNPMWVAWLMGWPIGATASQCLETDRCPNKWWRPLSPCSTRQLDTCTTETSDG